MPASIVANTTPILSAASSARATATGQSVQTPDRQSACVGVLRHAGDPRAPGDVGCMRRMIPGLLAIAGSACGAPLVVEVLNRGQAPAGGQRPKLGAGAPSRQKPLQHPVRAAEQIGDEPGRREAATGGAQ
ncbi:hypothetical protein HN018_11790 [Lichenicola cladoniae]|uniref:Uncharacterized protein n=1 Tax=Lichenicola cladoniae TaxID=1484109 RepID=A0A6M8HQS6_9PROT|nr:hypothetical protein [Lichenicola cladoniae]NPD68045.1 hypothetical protein [Acetobacteraceae bacterium]QKE90625.1 hypothetical protein HN018_11790 [Lichenicola cladoniae]